MQMSAGRLFLHEHPEQASSWTELCIQKMLSREGVFVVEMDQCQFDQKDQDGRPIRKPTRWMSNSLDILGKLDKRCGRRDGTCSATNSAHTTCNGKTAKQAAIYPFQLCKAILECLW